MINNIKLVQANNFNELYCYGHFVGIIIIDKRKGKYKAISCLDAPNKVSESLFQCVLHLLNVSYLFKNDL